MSDKGFLLPEFVIRRDRPDLYGRIRRAGGEKSRAERIVRGMRSWSRNSLRIWTQQAPSQIFIMGLKFGNGLEPW